MTEHLFKLKKDGKTVGYEKHALIKSVKLGDFNSIIIRPEKFIIHDEKCLFVTKDKNDKNVFAEDKVKVNGIIAIVKWDARECRYMLSTIPSLCEYSPALYDNMGSKFLWSDIELIKDKEDE